MTCACCPGTRCRRSSAGNHSDRRPHLHVAYHPAGQCSLRLETCSVTGPCRRENLLSDGSPECPACTAPPCSSRRAQTHLPSSPTECVMPLAGQQRAIPDRSAGPNPHTTEQQHMRRHAPSDVCRRQHLVHSNISTSLALYQLLVFSLE